MHDLGETRYAQTVDGGHIAYRVMGHGGLDLVLMTDEIIPAEALADEPSAARVLDRLASFGRVVLFDRRGTGLSDPISPSALPTWDQWMRDTIAVMDAAGSARAALLGFDIYGGPLATLLSVTLPHRFSSLVLVHSVARVAWAEDYPWGLRREEHERIELRREREWAEGFPLLGLLAPSVASAEYFRTWWRRWQPRGASPATAVALGQMHFETDIREVLGTIQLPTLVMHREGNRYLPVEHGRYLAEHIPGAKYVELPGDDHWVYVGETGVLLDEIEEFLTGTHPRGDPDRVLATVLFTDIVDSTRELASRGDATWRYTLDAHDEGVRRQLARFGGREVRTTGDGFLATFDGPARAIRAGCAIRDLAAQQGLRVRVGLHTGEIGLRGDDLVGIAVHIGQRVSAKAQPGEVLVSRTVKDLVAGSGLAFRDRGAHTLKGVPGRWRLFAVE
jgi:class 3 adenylate cyclase/pimeloyl-ACP methyl ester carboxylesterase